MTRLRGGARPGGGAFAVTMFCGSLVFIVNSEHSLEMFTSAIFMLACLAAVWYALLWVGRAFIDRTHGFSVRRKRELEDDDD